MASEGGSWYSLVSPAVDSHFGGTRTNEILGGVEFWWWIFLLGDFWGSNFCWCCDLGGGVMSWTVRDWEVWEVTLWMKLPVLEQCHGHAFFCISIFLKDGSHFSAIHSWTWLMQLCTNWSSVSVSGLNQNLSIGNWSSIMSSIIGQTWGLQSQHEQDFCCHQVTSAKDISSLKLR